MQHQVETHQLLTAADNYEHIHETSGFGLQTSCEMYRDKKLEDLRPGRQQSWR